MKSTFGIFDESVEEVNHFSLQIAKEMEVCQKSQKSDKIVLRMSTKINRCRIPEYLRTHCRQVKFSIYIQYHTSLTDTSSVSDSPLVVFTNFVLSRYPSMTEYERCL